MLLLLASPATADPCKGAEPEVRAVVRELTALASRASAAAVRCGIRGADADLATKLREEGKRVAADEQGVAKWEACGVGAAGLNAVGLVTNEDSWAGELLSEALGLCAPKATGATTKAEGGCTALETWMLSFEEQMEKAAARATESAITCAFEGPDDKVLADFARDTKPLLQNVAGAAPKAKCAAGPVSLRQISRLEGGAMGERIGFAFAMCSTQMRTRLNELARTRKLTQEVIASDPVFAKATASYVDEVLPRWN
jgi:hypothetical protein